MDVPNYNTPGTAPLRSNEDTKHATPIRTVPSGKPAGGTGNLRAFEITKRALMLTTPTGKGAATTPPMVRTFPGDTV